MISQTNCDALAERIRTGIAQKGVHMLLKDELTLIFQRQRIKSDREKLMLILDFATSYAFDVHVNDSKNIAVFKKTKSDASA